MTMFNKRHYETLALIMQASCPEPHWDANKRAQWEVTRNRMADAFRNDNSLFKADRFIAACEPGSNVKLRTKYKIAS